MQSISSDHPFFPPSFPLHPSFRSSFGQVVCQHWLCGIPLIHWFLTSRHILRPYPCSFLPVVPLYSIDPSPCYIVLTCYCIKLKFLEFLQFLHWRGSRRTDLSITVYTVFACEEYLESTTISPARELCSIKYFELKSLQELGDFCWSEESLPPSNQFVAVRVHYLCFVQLGQVANVEIFHLEVGCSVEVSFVGILWLLNVLYGIINIFSPLFHLPCSSRL